MEVQEASGGSPRNSFLSKCKVNKALIPIKLHYFFYFGAIGPVYPFFPLIATTRGFSSTLVGFAYGIMPFVAVIAKPLMGGLADKFNAHKVFLVAFLLFEALVCFTFQWLSSLPTSSPVNLSCNRSARPVMKVCPTPVADFLRIFKGLDGNVSCEVVCDERTSVTFDSTEVFPSEKCFLIPVTLAAELSCNRTHSCDLKSCSNDIVKDFLEIPNLEIEEAVHYGSFWLFLFFITLVKICISVDVSIADTICVNMVENKPFAYGYQRLWGSLAYGLSNPLASLLTDSISDGPKKNFLPLYYVSLGLFACGLTNAFFIKWQPDEKPKGVVKSLYTTFQDVHVVFFLLTTLIFGIFTQIIWVNIIVYIETIAQEDINFTDENWLTTLEGLMIMIECFAEIPFFFISNVIISKLGHELVYTSLLAVWAVRFLGYHLLVHPWLVLPLEIFNGLTFGLFYATMVTYANIVAPPGAKATVQGTTCAVFEGVGLGLGGFLGSWLVYNWGLRRMFLTMSVFALVACVCHGAVYFLLRCGGKRKKPEVDIAPKGD